MFPGIMDILHRCFLLSSLWSSTLFFSCSLVFYRLNFSHLFKLSLLTGIVCTPPPLSPFQRVSENSPTRASLSSGRAPLSQLCPIGGTSSGPEPGSTCAEGRLFLPQVLVGRFETPQVFLLWCHLGPEMVSEGSSRWMRAGSVTVSLL